jgi:O-antigen ligase
MVAEAIANSPVPRRGSGWFTAKTTYFRLAVALTLMVAVASFVRDRGQLLSNISFWLFLVPFVVTLLRAEVGFLAAILLLTITPSLHEQSNALAGANLHAWAYPAVDCCLGFLAAWTFKGGLRGVDNCLSRFPSGPLLLFHAWVVLSAVIAVARNIWQSASELSLRGFAFNVWLTRGISWHDDYYPLQDPFFYSVALAMFFGAWALLCHGGEGFFKKLMGVVLAGATANVAFALWQRATGLGWINGQWSINANALWPDLHSFAAFMAAALSLGCGLLLTRGANPAVWLSVLAAAIGLYLSGSRATLFLVFSVLIVWAVVASLKLRGWRRAIPMLAVVAVASAVHWTLDHGYRGISYASLSQQFHALDLKSLNEALSNRPEIWAAALYMYSGFPFFGLGQGAFYRLSAVPEFSGSEFLSSMRGEGVHNEFLRILVELGPVGVGLLAFSAVPVIGLGRQNLQLVSFYALVGMLIGNLYTNAMLVRELLMLSAVFVGSYFWEAQSVGLERWRPPVPTTMRYASIVLVALTLAALVEVALSFGRFPFTYGLRCLEVHPLSDDGWTQGVLRAPVPLAAASAEITVIAENPGLERRRLDLDLSVLSGGGVLLATEQYSFTERNRDPRSFQLPIPESPDGKRFLEVKPFPCYIPLNFGITYDPRRLGVRVNALRFRTADGGDVR